MIHRVVLIKLEPEYVGDIEQVVAHSAEVLEQVPMVRRLEAVSAADPRTRKDWDICLLIEFDAAADVEAYRDHPIHRKYVDIYLRPMLAGIRAYNFEAPGR